jgi:hypothetical protein
MGAVIEICGKHPGGQTRMRATDRENNTGIFYLPCYPRLQIRESGPYNIAYIHNIAYNNNTYAYTRTAQHPYYSGQRDVNTARGRYCYCYSATTVAPASPYCVYYIKSVLMCVLQAPVLLDTSIIVTSVPYYIYYVLYIILQ